MAKTVPPTGNQAFAAFCVNMEGIVSAAPTVLGLTASQATTLSGLTTDYVARLATSTEPSTRTKVTIAATNTSKAALLLNVRTLLKIIDAHPGTTNAQRESLGMNLPDSDHSPRPAPTTQPVVNIAGSGGGLADLRLRDATTPDKKAKPPGVFGALVATAITDQGDPAPAFAPDVFNAVATRTNHTLPLPPGSAGKVLWVQARWMNERGQPGPSSVVASALIAA
jgi:hypothetical protein